MHRTVQMSVLWAVLGVSSYTKTEESIIPQKPDHGLYLVEFSRGGYPKDLNGIWAIRLVVNSSTSSGTRSKNSKTEEFTGTQRKVLG